MSYDNDNIFAKILRKEIPCDKIYEDDSVLAFRDISPQAPQHVLIIPKGAYKNVDDFASNAKDGEIAALFRAVGKIAGRIGVNESGYRIIINCGNNGGQEVPHLHLHILGGRKLGRMVSSG